MALADWLSWPDTTTSLVFLVTLMALVLWKSSQRKQNAPPGPFVWPIVGNLPQIFVGMRKYKSQFRVFEEFSKVYGSVFSLRMGPMDTVIVTDYENIKEILQVNATDYIDRPVEEFLEQFSHGNGIILSNGKKWEEIRKFTVMALRELGMGKRSLEFIIQNEAQMISEKMSTIKEPFHPKHLMVDAVANIIINMIYGQRFDYDDADFSLILNKLEYVAKTFGPVILDRFLPFLKYLPVDTPGKKVLREQAALQEYTNKKITEHRQTYDPNITRDFIDMYIKVLEEGHKYSTLTEPHLFHAILDLYLAGAETTSTSLDWFILYMVVFPEVQEKCQQEIDEAVGQGRQVSMDDKKALVYTSATLQELQRIANVLATTAAHAPGKDILLGGFLIPKGTAVFPQILSVHMNPEYFDEPKKFKPERWIDSEGKLTKSDHFLPFGIGPRKCVGENLAKMELFLFAANFLQQYTFKLPKGQPTPTTEAVHTGLSLQAKPYHIIMEPRN